MILELISDFSLKVECNEGPTIPFVKFILELNPMEPESMQEAFHRIHAEKDSESSRPEHWKAEDHLN